VLWVELPQEIDSLVLMELAMADGIVIAPGPLFSADRQYQNFIRINCGTAWSPTIESGICRLGRLVARMLENSRSKTVLPMPRWNKHPAIGAYGRG
jgi:DNA-binding transcriptional MocR family regulator